MQDRPRFLCGAGMSEQTAECRQAMMRTIGESHAASYRTWLRQQCRVPGPDVCHYTLEARGDTRRSSGKPVANAACHAGEADKVLKSFTGAGGMVGACSVNCHQPTSCQAPSL